MANSVSKAQFVMYRQQQFRQQNGNQQQNNWQGTNNQQQQQGWGQNNWQPGQMWQTWAAQNIVQISKTNLCNNLYEAYPKPSNDYYQQLDVDDKVYFGTKNVPIHNCVPKIMYNMYSIFYH